MSKKDFKYKARFEFTASMNRGNLKQAKASNHVFDNFDLTALRSLLPNESEVEENDDLLYTAFNASVVNVINANDHGIDTDTALAISKYFVHKQLNVEHDRYNIVGHIISQGFSSFSSKTELLQEADLSGKYDPFNICLGAVIYKPSREWLVDMIEESTDPTAYYYGEFSASWEIGYNEFHVLKGSKKLKDAERISDPEEIAKLAPYLRAEGGTGFLEDGTPVYCLIVGDARPLGCAITGNPAAPVKGMLVASRIEAAALPIAPDPKLEEIQETLRTVAASTEENKANLLELNKTLKQKEKNSVILNCMKLKSINELGEFLKSAEASVAEASIKDFLKDELKKEADKFADEITSLTKGKETVATELTNLKDQFAIVQDSLDKVTKELQATKEQATFDTRMDELNSKFELNDTQKSAIASQIKGLDEKAFASWKTSFELFAKTKEAAASAPTPDLNQSLENASPSTASASIPNASAPEEDELTKLEKSLTNVFN